MAPSHSLRAVSERLATARERRRRGRRDVCVLGPGKAFLSGVTYHTYALASALAEHGDTRVILLRNLVPRRFYPGRHRVGADISHVRLPAAVGRVDGVDWWFGTGGARAIWSLLRRPPAILVVQVWTAAVWHVQIVLALVARAGGSRVVLEVHELMDPGEARYPAVRAWGGALLPLLVRTSDAIVVHNDLDAAAVRRRFGRRAPDPVVVPEPPFDCYRLGGDATQELPEDEGIVILHFGTVRPYKGLEDLVDAFGRLVAREPEDPRRLAVVGEPWEGWTEPFDRIRSSPVRSDIEVVDRYVTDEEVDAWFRRADVVVLPYRRSSTSGPLMVAMSYGLPVVVTEVGGLPEAVADYSGAVIVPPNDVEGLVEGIRKAEALIGQVHEAGRSWAQVAADHEALYRELGAEGRR